MGGPATQTHRILAILPAPAAAAPAPAGVGLADDHEKNDDDQAHRAMDSPDSVPLTGGQKARLIANCLPFVSLAVMIVLYVTVGTPIVGAPPPALYLLLGVALLVTGYHALKAWRDLQSGVALVREDVLERSARARSRGPGKFSGRFSELGRLRMTSQSYVQGQPGLRRRVVYSPASRLVWSAEPLGGLEALLASYEHEP